MNNTTMKDHSIVAVVGILLAGAVGYGIYRAYIALRDVNKGTPFEGTGAVGTLAHATDAVLGGAPSAVGEAAGGALYDVVHPYNPKKDVYYTVTFPDGQKHAIQASTVDDATGFFVTPGGIWSLKQDANGHKYAVAE